MIRSITKKLPFALILLMGFDSPAYPILRRLDISQTHFLGHRNFPVMPGITPTDQLQLQMDIGIFEFLTWRNRIHALTSKDKFEWVGWDFSLDLSVTSWLTITGRHHSQHRLDALNRYGFPNENAVGIIFHIVTPSNPTPIF